MTLPVVTIEDIRSWKPCEDPVTHFGLPEDWQGNAFDLLDAKGNKRLSDYERLWAVLRVEVLPEPLMSEVLVAVVRETPLADGRIVSDLLTDSRFEEALDARLKWGRGEITYKQLEDALSAVWTATRAAAWSAAWYAAWAATQAAARDAAWYAALAATRDAAHWSTGRAGWDAARDAALAAQVELAKRVIQEAAK